MEDDRWQACVDGKVIDFPPERFLSRKTYTDLTWR
jgi:hypothetical protein